MLGALTGREQVLHLVCLCEQYMPALQLIQRSYFAMGAISALEVE